MRATSVSTRRRTRQTKEQRDQIVLDHLPLVKAIAIRVHESLPVHVDLDDLIHAGVMGLFDAVTKYDCAKKVQFHSYAKHRIKGAILDSLRQLDWAPRTQRRHAKQIDAAIAVTEQRLQRAPDDAEIAAELNLTVEGYHKWQVNISGLNLGRLEPGGPEDSENGDLLRFVSGDPKELPSALFERSELLRVLTLAISGIPAIEKTVLSLYYRGELTLREIAKIVGLHESRISQLRTQAILRLRLMMAKLWPSAGHRPEPPPGSIQTQAA